MNAVDVLPPVAGRIACVCCPPQAETPSLDWQPHPGFGGLDLLRDVVTADGWHDFCDMKTCPPVLIRWKVGKRAGFVRAVVRAGLEESVTLGEIDEACAADPGHDWRLVVHGPLRGATYQRQGRGVWVLVETNGGFA